MKDYSYIKKEEVIQKGMSVKFNHFLIISSSKNTLIISFSF